MRTPVCTRLPALLIATLVAACAAEDASTTDEPSCDGDTCEDVGEAAPLEFCKDSFFGKCRTVTFADNLCQLDGDYMVADTHKLAFTQIPGSKCGFNATLLCHSIHVSRDATHLLCEFGAADIPIGFDGVPLDPEGIDVCEGAVEDEVRVGYVHNREFTVTKSGSRCTVSGDAARFQGGSINCHKAYLTVEGFTCHQGADTSLSPLKG